MKDVWRWPKVTENFTVTEVEAAIGTPASEWKGRCYEIASRVEKSGLLPGGAAVYGHFLGRVSPRSMFDFRAPFQRHGWMVLLDGTVVDFTRWVFEAVEPYVWTAPAARAGFEYDEGGNAFRETRRETCPSFDSTGRVVELSAKILPSAAWSRIEKLLGDRAGWIEFAGDDDAPKIGEVSVGQLAWIANAPYTILGPEVRMIYKAIEALGYVELIPIDNRRRAEREHG